MSIDVTKVERYTTKLNLPIYGYSKTRWDLMISAIADSLDDILGSVKDEVTAARGGAESLLLKNTAQDEATAVVALEIVNARSGQPTLLARLNQQFTLIEEYGGVVSEQRLLAQQAAAVAAVERALADLAKQSSNTNALAAAAAAASIQDTAARVGAILRSIGITNIKAIAFKSAEGWEKTGQQSYKTETRPLGRNLGYYANATAAWGQTDTLPATVAGDWYFQTTGTIGLFECTTSNASSQRYRSGSDHMPLEAVFVEWGLATGQRLMVFDLTDPLMPLWMDFARGAGNLNAGSNSTPAYTAASLRLSNGVLYSGRNSGVGQGVLAIDFERDRATFYQAGSTLQYAGVISGRNNGLGWKQVATNVMPSSLVAGIDEYKGYIAAATAGGLSVVKPDGTVVKSAATSAFLSVLILNGRLYAVNDSSPDALLDYGPIESLSAGFVSVNGWSSSLVPPLSGASLISLGLGDNSLLIGQTSVVDQFWPNPADKESSLIARRGTKFATPPMKKPELMLICSTVEGSVSDANNYDADFSADANGFTSKNANTSLSVVGGKLRVTLTIASGTEYPVAERVIPCVSGRLYRIRATVAHVSGNSVPSRRIVFRSTTDVALGGRDQTLVGDGSFDYFKVADVATMYLRVGNQDSASDAVFDWSDISVEEVVEDRSGKSKHATINGTLTATAEVAGGVAGLSGFDSAADYLEAANPWDGIGTGDGWIAGAFKCAASTVDEVLLGIGYHDGASLVDSVVLINLWSSAGQFRARISSNALVANVTAETTSGYDDGLLHTFVIRKTSSGYFVDIDGKPVASVGAGAHGDLIFSSSAKLRVGLSSGGSSSAPNSTIWFVGGGKTSLSDEEVSLMHTHMRNLIVNKASLDEIPSALAYNAVTKAVEMVGATYRQTMIDGAIVSSVAHGQGTTPAVAAGSRGEIAIGGTTGLSISVPERNLREYQARLTTELFTVKYAGNATGSRVLFPLPSTAAEMSVTLDAKPVRVSNAGVVQTEGASDDYTVRDYGLGRYVVQFAVAPADGNDVLIEFEREVWK